MKKINIKPRIEIINNTGFDASYVKSDNIRFSSTYQNISSVEHLYFSISGNADTVWLSSIVWRLCPTLWSEYRLPLFRPTIISMVPSFRYIFLYYHTKTHYCLHQFLLLACGTLYLWYRIYHLHNISLKMKKR